MCNRCILFIRTVNVFIFFDHILPLTFHMIHGGGTIYFLHIPLDVMNMIIFFAQFLPLLSSHDIRLLLCYNFHTPSRCPIYDHRCCFITHIHSRSFYFNSWIVDFDNVLQD